MVNRTHSMVVELVALELVHKHDLDEIKHNLLEKGVLSQMTEKLVLFIPSAFAAEHFESQGIMFSKEFYVGEPGQYQSRLYSYEPIYLEARELAKRWAQEGRPSLIARVLEWSAEAIGIEEARALGLTPKSSGPVHHGLCT